MKTYSQLIEGVDNKVFKQLKDAFYELGPDDVVLALKQLPKAAAEKLGIDVAAELKIYKQLSSVRSKSKLGKVL